MYKFIIIENTVHSISYEHSYIRTKILSQSLATVGYPELAEKETVDHPYNSAERTHERSNLDLEAMAKIYESVEIWPTYPSPLCSETSTKVKVSCININCDYEDKRD
jgi:hypothetical protein